MSFDSIVRVSFQSETPANQAANKALVGHAQDSTGTGPYQRIGTALYSCNNASEQDVAQSIYDLGIAVLKNANHLDFVSISVGRRKND